MFLSDTAKNNEPQLVRRIYEKAKQYDDVLDLTLGDPDIPTPQAVKDAACLAVMKDKTKYTLNAGLPELRRAFSADVEHRTGLKYDIDEITVTAGAMDALFLTTAAVINPGDEMIILEPHWPNYTNMVKMAGGVPVYVNYLGEENMRCLEQNIEKAVTEKTRAIIINSPSNPTGIVLSFEKLYAISKIAQKHDLIVITDEVYRTIVFDGSFRSILELPGMKDRTVLIDSVSKRFSMTGFRIGFVCAPREIAGAVAALQENVNSCACMFAQYAAITALENSQTFEKEICGIFRKRCSAAAAALKRAEKITVADPAATFYIFANIGKTGLSSTDFAYKLLESKHVAVVPGNAFNKAGEGYIRIACTLSEEKLVEAANRIADFVNEL